MIRQLATLILQLDHMIDAVAQELAALAPLVAPPGTIVNHSGRRLPTCRVHTLPCRKIALLVARAVHQYVM